MSDFNYHQYLLLFAANFHLTLKRLNQIEEVYPNLSYGIQDNFQKMNGFTWFSIDYVKYEKMLKKVTHLDIKTLDLTQPNYPPQLLDLTDPPVIIFYKGNISLAKSKILTVVGSRDIQTYSTQIATQIFKQLANTNLVIASGLALGVDTLAHNLALQNNLKTLAIIGSGFDPDVFYPKQNLSLMTKIIDHGGLIISEYPPDFFPTRFSFPQRNRLLAALAQTTWVIQANLNSGSLITVEQAYKLNKIVATTPASVLDKRFSGNLQLLKENSKIISQAEDVFKLMNLSSQAKMPALETKIQNPEHQQIFDILTWEPCNIEEIANKLNIEINRLSAELNIMELNNLCKHYGYNEWAKV